MKNSIAKITTTIVLAIVTIKFTPVAQATESMIYGWDIFCKDKSQTGLTVRARQSDDDFYIDIKSKTIKKMSVWADSNDQFDSRLKTLLFVTDHEYSEGHTVSLTVNRTSTKNEQYGTGVIYIEDTIYPLNCFIRYGVDEEDFDRISRKRFPSIQTDANL